MNLKVVLASVLAIQSSVSQAGPRDDAREETKRTMLAARQDAASLLKNDLDTLTYQLAMKTAAPIVTDLSSQIETLHQRALALMEENGTYQDKEKFRALWDQYKAQIRERLKLSFDAQRMVNQREMGIRNFELLLDGFADMCRNGRSEDGLDYRVNPMPNLPSRQYEYQISFSTGDGGNGVQVKGSSSNSTGNDKSRQQVGAALNTTAGITSSIAFSGGSGAVVSYAMAAAPYMVAAAAAYAVISDMISGQEQAALSREIAQGTIDRMLNHATDQDVARFYVEKCQAIQPKISHLLTALNRWKVSDDAQNAAIIKARLTKAARQLYADESKALNGARRLYTLAKAVEAAECPSEEKRTRESLCYKTATHFVSNEDLETKLLLDLKAEEGRLQQASEKLKAFAEKYPTEKILEWREDDVAEVLYERWTSLTQAIGAAQFDSVDATLNDLFLRVLQIHRQMIKATSAKWNQSNTIISNEIEINRQFEFYKVEFHRLLKLAVEVLFGRANSAEAKTQLRSFLVSFDEFAKTHFLSPDVRDFNTSTKALREFYEQL